MAPARQPARGWSRVAGNDVRLTRSWRAFVPLLIAGVSLLALMLARRAAQPIPTPAERASPLARTRSTGYADPAVCSTCHEEIAPTYALTGMARAFSRVAGSQFAAGNRVYHEASDRYYTMVQRDGKLYQRRHQVGFGGTETNVLELEAHYVVGSGNHARTFLHRTPDGRSLQLPVSWYAERGGYLGDEPGVRSGRPHGLPAGRRCRVHVVSQRLPACARRRRRRRPAVRDALPEGIDCQRCHGPGQAHVEAVKAATSKPVGAGHHESGEARS